MCIELICTPVDTKNNPVASYDDEILDYDDLGKNWFFSFLEAKIELRKIIESKQNTIFNYL